jgi:DNA-binding CsgD family transcriptional regulator
MNSLFFPRRAWLLINGSGARTAPARAAAPITGIVEDQSVVATGEGLRRIVADARWADLARVIDEEFFALMLVAPDEIRDALSSAPDQWLQNNPRYLMAREIVLRQKDGTAFVTESVNQLFSRWVASSPGAAARDVLIVQLGQIRYLVRVGRFAEASKKADEILATIDQAVEPSGFLDVAPVVLIRVGIAKLLAAEIAEAIACFADASRWASIGRRHPIWQYSEDYLALALAIGGNITQARGHLQHDPSKTRAEVGTLAHDYEIAGILANAIIGIGNFDRDATAAAIDKFDHDLTDGAFWWLASHIRARFALYWGDRDAATTELEDKLLYERALAGPRSLAGILARADLADLYQAGGNLSASLHVLDRPHLDAGHILLVPTRARAELLLGHPEQALARLADTEPIAAQRTYAPPALLIVKAAAETSLGATTDATETLKQAANAIRRSGALHMTAEALPEIRGELARLLGLEPSTLPDVYPAGQPFNRLTPREQDVLRALGEHTSIKGIAAALHVSPNTAKTHLRSLYRKLSVHTREQALRHADAADGRPFHEHTDRSVQTL